MRLNIFAVIILFSICLSAQDIISLEECKQIALKHNINLQIDSANINVAIYNKRATFANFFPNINFSGTYLRLNNQFQLFENDLFLPVVPHQAIDFSTMQLNPSSFNNPLISLLTFAIDPSTLKPLTDANGNPIFRYYAYLPADQAKFGVKDNYIFNFSLIQPIFAGGKIFYANKMTDNAVMMAKYQTEIDKQSLLYDIEDMYYKLWITEKKYKLALNYLELLKQLEQDVKNYLQEGMATNNQLLMVQTKINEAEVNVFKAQNGLNLQKQLLNQKMGRKINTDFILQDSLMLDEEFLNLFLNSENDVINRPEIKLLEQNVEFNKNMLRVTQADMLPQIGFTTNYFFINPNPYNGLAKEFGNDYTLGVTIKVPIFHALEKYNKRQAALVQYKIAQMKMDETKDLIYIDATYSANQLKEQLMQLNATKKNVELATENLRLQTNLYHEGVIKLADLMQAQTMWLDAKTSYYEAYAEVLALYAKLRKAYGIIE
jgi:outer membrane protein TolC